MPWLPGVSLGSRWQAMAWWDFPDGGVGSAMVVDVDELVDQVLEAGQCLGGWSGGHPFLEGLLEAFNFAGGGWMDRPGVFVGDAELSQAGLDLVSSARVAGEANHVDGNPSGS